MKKVELLAPAGNLEKLKYALIYGADAVYMGGKRLGLRASADNFTLEEMREGVEFAHKLGRKVYLTLNIFAHNEDFEGAEEYIRDAASTGIDAVLISDPGVLSIVKEVAPGLEVHLSTQANNTNFRSAAFWHSLGVKRVVLARELSFDEIREIRAKTPASLDFECFVHGAMCISYSGRCLLSNYMAGRDANRGECAHACRWKYHLVEEKRPGEYMPVYEDDKGTYIYNSKDLCMIGHIDELIEAGISSLKIEGRMKSAYYVATVVKTYRDAIDAYYRDPENYTYDPSLLNEVNKASHREYTTGFFYSKPGPNEQIYNSSSYIREYDFIGVVLEYDKETKIAKIEQRNRMFKGDKIEVMNPERPYFTQNIKWMKNEDGEEIEVAPNAQMIVYMPMEKEVAPYTILRKEAE
jgi:putative protease